MSPVYTRSKPLKSVLATFGLIGSLSVLLSACFILPGWQSNPELSVFWAEDFTSFNQAKYYQSGNCLSLDDAGGWIQLTTDSAYCASRLFFDTPTLIDEFTAEFDFRIRAGTGSGADGFTFAFLERCDYAPAGANPVVGSGKWLGIEGASGFSVEFDTYCNYESDPNYANHIAVVRDSVMNHLLAVESPNLEDEAWHHAQVTFERGEIWIYLDGELVTRGVVPDFVPYEGFFGFTAATGEHTSTHEIDNISVKLQAVLPVHNDSSVLLLVDENLRSEISDKLSRYIHDVESAYPEENLGIDYIDASDATSIRATILSWRNHSDDRAHGVILVGNLPCAVWEFPWGEICPLPLYYEDLDGSFSDTDGNGLLDFHNWDAHEAPDVWVAYMPGYGTTAGQSISQYLDKLHDYYAGVGVYADLGSEALLYVSDDWAGPSDTCVSDVFDALANWLSVTRVCGNTSASGFESHITSGIQQVVDLWVHSSSEEHFFDEGSCSRTAIQSLSERGGILTILWGCHAGDFLESHNRSIAQAYIFGNSAGLVSVAAVRSIGTEYQQYFIEAASKGPIGEAYKAWLDHVYSQALIASRFPDDDVNRFVWDFVLFGDPFLTL